MTDAPTPAREAAPRGDGDDARQLALLAHRLGGLLTLADAYDAAAAATRDVLRAGVAAVARRELDQWQVLAADPADEAAAVLDAVRDGEAARALDHRQETWRNGPGEDAGRSRPALVAPVVVNGELWGALCAVRDAPALPFTRDDAARGEVLGTLLGAHIARLDLAEQVRHLVSDDALTGLSTRRVADEAAQAAIDSGDETCIVMCDVDGLKRVNDELGHDAGDDLLRAVAAVLRRASSGLPGSTAARIGGDEFCIVTCGIPRTTVVQVMDATVGDATLPHGSSLSYGIASSARGSLGAAPTPRSLFRRADAAQYHAKRSHAAARARQYRADDPGAVLGRAVAAGVTALAATAPAPLSRLCALAAALTEAMGGSGWTVSRDAGASGDGPVVVARGGTSSLHVSGMRQVELVSAPWTVQLESTLSSTDRTVGTTLQTLVSLAVLGAS
ncbi:GGDEF domain-containing protein [Cellulomonas sp. P4]|uniref:GGDEF domain-containing protein n=1 Tax=Cellulomonas sp. P4 TaxID=3142533 RepID=UPI0031BB2936